MTRSISIGLVVTCFVIMTAWDIYPAITPETGDTISEATRDIGALYYTLPYVWGILAGHFFFNKEDRSTRSLAALWITSGLFCIRDMTQFATFQGGTPITFVLGVIAGAVWWPQAPGDINADNPQE